MSSYYPPSTVIPIYSVFMGVGVALTALRLWVRLSYARISLGLDDFFLLFGLAVACTCNGIQYYNSLKGTGGEAIAKEDAHAQEQKVVIAHQIDWAMIVIEKFGFGAVKMSILFFYRRIFGVWASFRRANNILLWIVGIWALGFTIADILICGVHPELIWGFDQTIALDRCGNRGALLLAFAVTSVATDLPVLGLPFFYIARLQMAKEKKWATSFVFLIGSVSTGASILRLIFLIVSYPVGRLNFAYTAPPPHLTPLVLKIFNPTFWAMTELWLGVWAANLPPCSPLIRGLNLGFHPYRVISSVYRRTWTRKSSTASSEQGLRAAGVGMGTSGDEGMGKRESHGDEGMGQRGSHGDEGMGQRISHQQEWSQDSGFAFAPRDRGLSVTSEKPPLLSPMEWTGTGRLSFFGLGRMPSSASVKR